MSVLTWGLFADECVSYTVPCFSCFPGYSTRNFKLSAYSRQTFFDSHSAGCCGTNGPNRDGTESVSMVYLLCDYDIHDDAWVSPVVLAWYRVDTSSELCMNTIIALHINFSCWLLQAQSSLLYPSWYWLHVPLVLLVLSIAWYNVMMFKKGDSSSSIHSPGSKRIVAPTRKPEVKFNTSTDLTNCATVTIRSDVAI